MRSVFLLLLLLLASCPAWGWVTIAQSRYGAQVSSIRALFDNTTAPSNVPPQQLLGYMWNLPSDATSKAGLGGGITWAWDPNFCSQILNRFKEDFFFVPFVTCSMLKAAMGRGFQSWSANSVHISFTDVTQECEKIGQLNEDCPLAEIWVTANEKTPSSSRQLNQVELKVSAIAESLDTGSLAVGGKTSAALAFPKPQYQSDFHYTNGVRPNAPTVIETLGARVSFNTDLCWYLDSTFCYSFHNIKTRAPQLSANDLHWIVRGILAGIWLLAFGILALQVCFICRASSNKSKGINHKCHAWIDSLHRRSMVGISIRLVLLILPPAFYLQIFLPCWECYDFEAAATHEVGHVLGLSHPDTVATALDATAKGPSGQNVYASNLLDGKRMSTDNGCLRPWDSVVAGTPPNDLSVPADGVRPSIMKALTQHNPRVCLSEDDLEALNTLYPDCSSSISVPVCDKVAYNIGWVRLGVWVLAPILVALILMLCVFAFTSHHQNKRLDAQIKLRMMRSADLLVVKKEKEEVDKAHRRMSLQLQEQKQTEEQRINREARRRSVAMLEQLKLSQISGYSGEASSRRLQSPSSPSPPGGPPGTAQSQDTMSEIGEAIGVETMGSKEWEEAVKSMPYIKPEPQFEHGTIGHTAEKLAGAIAGTLDTLKRRSTTGLGLSRRSSEHNTNNRGALDRARAAIGKKPGGQAPALQRHNSSEESVNAV